MVKNILWWYAVVRESFRLSKINAWIYHSHKKETEPLVVLFFLRLKLSILGWRERACIHVYKMASSSIADVMFDEDFDEILELLDEYFFETDEILSKTWRMTLWTLKEVWKCLFLIIVGKSANQTRVFDKQQGTLTTQNIKLKLKLSMQKEPNKSFH